MSESGRVDRSVVHRIAVEDGRITNPYANFETLLEKLNTLKPYLIEIARQEEYTTYRQTADEKGIFTARQSQVLGILGLHEDAIDNPLLSAVVVQKSDPPMVGEKYFNMVELTRNHTSSIPESDAERRSLWQDHVRAVRSHWSE